MTGWTPLFQQIIGSSIWNAPNHVRIAWVTLLATADKFGVSSVTAGGLAILARITRDEAQNALDVLSGPDEDTLTQRNEGRRIERVENGWRLLNWDVYREKAKKSILREANREAQAKYREKVDATKLESSPQKNDKFQHHPAVAHPTIEDVKKWLLWSKQNGSDYTMEEAKEAWTYLESVGWRSGKNDVVDWRTGIESQINFHRRQGNNNQQSEKNKPIKFQV